jgi:hypothetical protein
MRHLTWSLLATVLLSAPCAAQVDLEERVIALTPVSMGSAPSFSSFSLDSSTDAIEYIFQATDTTGLCELLVRYQTRAGTPPTYQISVQGVDGSGRADGVIKDDGGAGDASTTFTPPADGTWDGTMRRFTPTQCYVPTRGQWLAIVISYSSGTINGSNLGQFSTHFGGTARAAPYIVRVDSGAGTKFAFLPLFGYSNGSGAVRGFPVEAINITQYSSDSTPDERAVRLALKSGECSTFTLRGVRAQIRTPAAATALTVALYSGTSVLQTITLDSDQMGNNASNDQPLTVRWTDSTLSTLTCGSAYYIGFQAGSTSMNIALRELVVDAAGDMEALPGGADIYAATRSDAGAWSDATSTRYVVELLIESVTAASGGSGRVIGS